VLRFIGQLELGFYVPLFLFIIVNRTARTIALSAHSRALNTTIIS